MTSKLAPPERQRLRIVVRGAVQGVGFRPFVYRLAKASALAGWVNNSPQGVFIEVEGPRADLKEFLLRLEARKPPRSFIQSLEASWLDPLGYDGFQIRESETTGPKTALVLPDIATCPDCLREILDPINRRYRYPFSNCTNCGPRFSIIESLPYDRANTSMKSFKMCPACQAEYDDPTNRRFHAQPNACPVCGPQLEFWRVRVRENTGDQKMVPRSDERSHDALLAAVAAIRNGQIVAVKGIGGFHLMVDVRNEDAIRRLRERKHREEKPFALMFPSLESAQSVCEVSALEERLLRSPEAPIVLLRRNKSAIRNPQIAIAGSVAPSNPNLGVMLPSNPLHHLLMVELGFPVIATSGNLSDEPICIDEREALVRLHDIADAFLVHNRPIIRHVDDSIVRVMLDREMVLRRARGYAPLPITFGGSSSARPKNVNERKLGVAELRPPKSILAVGPHLKNTVALSVGGQVFISQHIGDLETEQANDAFRRVIADFEKLYDAKPEVIAADLHPDYLSTKFAEEMSCSAPAERSDHGALGESPSPESFPKAASLESFRGCHRSPRLMHVQHHIAHVLSCMAENEIEPPALGVSWDGTGYGLDGTIWGGEFFLVTDESVERVAHFRPIRLPGGDKAVREPRRIALGLLYEMLGEEIFERTDLAPVCAFSGEELAPLKTMLARGLNSPMCCSVGRLFDAVASLMGLRQQIRFEGQAAMELEFALGGGETDERYNLSLVAGNSSLFLDWSPMIEAILADVKHSVPVGEVSAKFHNTLVEAIVTVAKRIEEPRVALSGGCFQNRYLTERTVTRLREEGFQPYWHQRVPPNDGGIALGQVVAALRPRREIINRNS